MTTFRSRPKLIDTRSGQEHRILKDDVVLGRLRDVDITIAVVEVSRRHCRIYYEDGLYYVEDLRTVNGTYVNEEAIYQPTVLQHGFHLKVAKCTKFPSGVRNFVFRDPEQAKRIKEVRAQHESSVVSLADSVVPEPVEKVAVVEKEKVALRHCLFKVRRKRGDARQVPLLKFSAEEVRFLSLFPLTRDEPMTLAIEHVSWAETIEIGLKVRRVTRIKTRPVFQVEADVAGWGKKQTEQCERLLGGGGLLKYFS